MEVRGTFQGGRMPLGNGTLDLQHIRGGRGCNVVDQYEINGTGRKKTKKSPHGV